MKRRAFSLIELSIVILIIGIMIAGITQGSRLVAQMKITSARTQTQSSPVASIKNLVTWFESTSETAFGATELDDGNTVTVWNDNNPQVTIKNNSSSVALVTYKANCINGLPCANFAGTGAGGVPAGVITSVPLGNPTAMTVFIVFTPTAATLALQSLITTYGVSNGTANNITYDVLATGALKYSANIYGTNASNSGTAITSNATAVVSLVDTGTTTPVSQYVNGVVSYTSPSGNDYFTNAKNLTTNLLIGAYTPDAGTTYSKKFVGYIGEVIIFDRALKAEERQSVEKYLGKKWGVKI